MGAQPQRHHLGSGNAHILTGGTKTTGFVLGVLSYGLFALHDAVIKFLVADLPAHQILFFRSAAILCACLIIGRRPLLERAVATPWKYQLFWRGVINMTAWLCYYTAARSLPLGQLTCLYFAAPVMITLMARHLLNEQVTATRWLSVGIGFVGVLFASDPFGLRLSLAAGLVLIAAALWGYGIILMRRIARQESSILQMLAINLVFTLGTGTACLWAWSAPTPVQLMALFSVAAVGGLAQFLVYEAARLIPASVLATVEYTALPWAFLLGFWFWGDVPPITVFVGAALIVLAGGMVVRAERRRS